jgi:hypothetical protein
MKPYTLKVSSIIIAPIAFIDTGWASEVVTNQEVNPKAVRIPLIQMEGVPLRDAIRNLARQANLNYILDPRIVGSFGIFHKEPSLTVRWENITAEDALKKVLKEHQLTMVLNPATTVARIIPKNVVAQPVPISQMGSDKAKPVSPIMMDDVPLSDAIKNLARYIGLNVILAPEITEMNRRIAVSVRWENITPRQALAALLDNYDLILIEGGNDSSARITLKTKAGNQ